MKTILDVYVLSYSTEEGKPLYNFINEFVYNLFNEKEIPLERSGVVSKLTNAVLKLSNSRINHILLHVLDQYFNLSEDSITRSGSKKFLAQPCFSKFRKLIVAPMEDIELHKELSKKLGFNYYQDYDNFREAELNIKKNRREKLQKLFGES